MRFFSKVFSAPADQYYQEQAFEVRKEAQVETAVQKT